MSLSDKTKYINANNEVDEEDFDKFYYLKEDVKQAISVLKTELCTEAYLDVWNNMETFQIKEQLMFLIDKIFGKELCE